MIVSISTGIDFEGGSENVEGCTEGESENVGLGGCTEKVEGCTKGEFEKVGNLTENVGGRADGES